ncbi:MAG: hypothetical protein LH629_14115, partial [Ignavibacteria bacterium]|nr:hypothetical protein [Ignavibacteria bacterium]
IYTDELIEFCKWISGYYISPIGEALFSAIPRKINITSEPFYSLTENYKENLDKSNFSEEIYNEIIRIFEKKGNLYFTKKQIEKRLKFEDLRKYLEK